MCDIWLPKKLIVEKWLHVEINFDENLGMGESSKEGGSYIPDKHIKLAYLVYFPNFDEMLTFNCSPLITPFCTGNEVSTKILALPGFQISL